MVLMDKIAVTTPGAQLAGFPGPRGAMHVGPGVSVPVFADSLVLIHLYLGKRGDGVGSSN